MFKKTYFEKHLQTAASALLIVKLVISTGHLPFHEGWFLLIRFVDLVRIYSVF